DSPRTRPGRSPRPTSRARSRHGAARARGRAGSAEDRRAEGGALPEPREIAGDVRMALVDEPEPLRADHGVAHHDVRAGEPGAELDGGEPPERCPLRARPGGGRHEVEHLEPVRDAELLEEPVDADGASAGRVVEDDHPRNPPTTETNISGCSYGTMCPASSRT